VLVFALYNGTLAQASHGGKTPELHTLESVQDVCNGEWGGITFGYPLKYLLLCPGIVYGFYLIFEDAC
jgi:hypothetical protein